MLMTINITILMTIVRLVVIIIILLFNKFACNSTAVDNYKFIRNTANWHDTQVTYSWFGNPPPACVGLLLGTSARCKGRWSLLLTNPSQTHATAKRQPTANKEQKFTVPLRVWNRER